MFPNWIIFCRLPSFALPLPTLLCTITATNGTSTRSWSKGSSDSTSRSPMSPGEKFWCLANYCKKTNQVQGLAVYSVLKNKADIVIIFSESISTYLFFYFYFYFIFIFIFIFFPPTCSLFDAKSNNWQLSLRCHLESFFSLFGATIVQSVKFFYIIGLQSVLGVGQGAASLIVTAKTLWWQHFFDDAHCHRHFFNRMTN